MRKDEFYELQDENKKLTAKFKEVSIGDTNSKIQELIEETKKQIEEIKDKIAPFKKAKAKIVT